MLATDDDAHGIIRQQTIQGVSGLFDFGYNIFSIQIVEFFFL